MFKQLSGGINLHITLKTEWENSLRKYDEVCLTVHEILLKISAIDLTRLATYLTLSLSLARCYISASLSIERYYIYHASRL